MTDPAQTRVSRWFRLGLCTLLTLGLTGTSTTESSAVAAGIFVVTEQTGRGRLRVAAQPGDLGLSNQQITAVVQKSTGWLVDFWTRRATLPTTPQLKDITQADGLWQLAPIIDDGRKATMIRYDSVSTRGDAIVAEALVRVAGARFRLETEYRLNGDAPEVHLLSRVSHESGGHLHIKFQEAIKWGNTDYFVEGNSKPLNDFVGTSRWIGRRGLCGDLKWIRLDPEPFHLTFRQSYPGLAPQIVASYALLVLKPGETHTFRRKLSYEPIVLDSGPAPPQGLLKVTVTDEAGQALAAKLSFSGRAGTPPPNFGNDGNEFGANRFAWSGTGHFARPLPVGSYRVMASAGIERAAQFWDIEIAAGQTLELSGSLPRVVETPGALSADLHLHQVESVDADLAHSSRLIAVAAEGVELAAATDHYAITDFAPTVARLVASGQLAKPLATMVGTEVSTVGNRFGHFNLFPVDADDWVNYTDTTPKQMLAEMRSVAPDAVLQVNHPRWPGIGYFQAYRMDPTTHRIPRALEDQYSSDFDAIEVFNGLDAYSHPRIRLVLRDWMSLLGQGHRYTATGNSDSHKLAFQDPGVPRNVIYHGRSTTDAQDIYVDEAAIVAAIKQGRVLVTSGPFIDAHIDGKGPGETVKTGGKAATLHVRVRAAPWIDVSHVEVLLGPKAQRLRWVPVASSQELVRYEQSIPIPGHAKTFVVVLAAGKRALPNVYATGVMPLAFTNPIWLEP